MIKGGLRVIATSAPAAAHTAFGRSGCVRSAATASAESGPLIRSSQTKLTPLGTFIV